MDERFMREAIELASNGAGKVDPNPLVGCVIVKDGRVIGRGWHTAFGKPHAEREALVSCAEDPSGSSVYVTLEPCCHTGKTPPCVDALIEAGVSRVVVGILDPNPLVAGKGCQILRDAGIEVVVGVCEDRCRSINLPFFKHVSTGLPYVVAKYACTLDGKIATSTGASRWVTGPSARRRVHADRARAQAVMVGVGTVLTDDPLLTCRLEGCLEPPRQPLRVVVDSTMRTPLDAQIVTTAGSFPTILFTSLDDCERADCYRAAGCEVAVVPRSKTPSSENRGVDLPAVLEALGQRGIASLIVEGGPTLLGALFDQGLVDAVQAYVAPKLFGGKDAPSPIGGKGVSLPSDAWLMDDPRLCVLGDDWLVEGEVRRCSRES